MVALACGRDARLAPSRLEAGPEVSYSIDTVERVLATETGRPLWFLIGADAFAEIGSWRRWQELIGFVSFIVVSRPGATYEIPSGARVERMEDVELPVSSSEVRRQLAEGGTSPDVPAQVARYIAEHHLYRRAVTNS